METMKMQAFRRDTTGKGAARQLRAKGLIPGVAYAKGLDTVAISLPSDSLRAALRAHHGGTVLLDLEIEGLEAVRDMAALIQEVQRDPISREVLSVDLHWVSLRDTTQVTVPLALAGECPGVEAGGALELRLHQVQIECLPMAIPDELLVDVSTLQLGETLHVRDIVPPEGIVVLTNGDDPVVSVMAPMTDAQYQARLSSEELEGVTLEDEEEVAE